MQLYTFILEFRGGTYIPQFRGDSPDTAIRRWVEELDSTPIAHLDKDLLKLEYEEKERDRIEPAAIDSVKNVWCQTFLLEEHLALLNIIKTDEN